jgi:hypothetical protein
VATPTKGARYTRQLSFVGSAGPRPPGKYTRGGDGDKVSREEGEGVGPVVEKFCAREGFDLPLSSGQDEGDDVLTSWLGW